jgi:hypothetical protein
MFTLSLALGLSLAGCSSSSVDQRADCGYFQDSALLLQSEINQAINNTWGSTDTYGGFKSSSYANTVITELKISWATKVLEAPEGCFPQSDMDQSYEWIGYKLK